MTDTLLCLSCLRYHPEPRCNRDWAAPCARCARPVGPGSESGPDVCWRCDNGMPAFAWARLTRTEGTLPSGPLDGHPGGYRVEGERVGASLTLRFLSEHGSRGDGTLERDGDLWRGTVAIDGCRWDAIGWDYAGRLVAIFSRVVEVRV